MGDYIEMTDDLLWNAREYSRLGFRMVVLHGIKDGVCTCTKGKDCGRSTGKHPVSAAWFTKASADYEEIRAQIGKSTRNLGLAMGGGYVALDIDGAEGIASLEAILNDHPPDSGPNGWPTTLTQRTGSGGYHFIFRTSENFSNKVKIWPGIDIRSRGGQIVAAPSLHHSGNRYALIDRKAPIADLPEWLADILRGTTKVTFDLQGWLMSQPVAISGAGGSNQLMRVTAQVIRKGGIRTVDQYLATIEKWNAQCQPPWSDKELEHAFDSAFGRYEQEATIELPVSKTGEVICALPDLHRIIAEDARYGEAFTCNGRSGQALFNGLPITDTTITSIRLDMCNRYRLRTLKRSDIAEAVELETAKRSFDPVRDYLSGLAPWDGIPRWVQVPTKLFHTEPNALYSSMLLKWSIGAVRRVFEPGVKVDHMLVLQGGQGCGKSTWLEIMAGSANYIDTRLDLDSKDSLQALWAWITEWSEIQGILRYDPETIKSFLSRKVDVYRAPYARLPAEHPRRGLVCGTTNREDFLTDPTGSRRFWPVRIPKEHTIDLKSAQEWRDALWAEATQLARQDHTSVPHWLTPAEEQTRVISAMEYRVDDPVYDSALDRLQGVSEILWNHLWQLCDYKSPPSGKDRDSLSRALRDTGFIKRTLWREGKTIRVWVRS